MSIWFHIRGWAFRLGLNKKVWRKKYEQDAKDLAEKLLPERLLDLGNNDNE
jgi:hypothetical protein